MTRVALLQKARQQLTDITPLARDCGRLCGAVCCQPDEEGRGGMLLFPGEEMLYGDHTPFAALSPSGFMVGDRELSLLTCEARCDREHRPLACRIFPLTPIARDGQLDIALDVRAWPVCPLMEHGMVGLSPRFVAAVREAMEDVWQDDLCRAYIEALTGVFAAYGTLLQRKDV